MVETQIFPEIHHYTSFLTSDERDLYVKIAQKYSKNSLNEQLEIVNNIRNKIETPSDILLFMLGKLLYNLSKFDMLNQELQKYKNNAYLLFWQGIAHIRKGDYQSAEIIFSELKSSEDVFIKTFSMHGIARLKNRQGKRKESLEIYQNLCENLESLLLGEKKDIFQEILLNCNYGKLWLERIEQNVEISKNKCKEFLHQAKNYGDRIYVALFQMLLGILEKYGANWGEAIRYFEQAQSSYRELKKERGKISAISNIAVVERMEGKLDNALKRLLEVITWYERWGDRRSVALAHSHLGEIYAQKREFTTSIQEFSISKEILDEIGSKDDLVDYSLAELLIEQGKIDDFNKVLTSILDGRNEDEINSNPHISYLLGKKEIQKLNIAKALSYLNQALKVAGEKRMDHLSAKIILDLLQVHLFNYISNPNQVQLDKCTKLLEDFNTFANETQQRKEVKNILEDINQKFISILSTEDRAEQRKIILETQKTIRELVNLIRYKITVGEDPIEISPNQLIILHRSGIPLKKYIKSEKIVDDILLFGGMVRAAKDIISEVFAGEIGKVMKIDYGENIVILAEFGEKDTGMVIITRKDTFHQRRSLHETVKNLNLVNIPSKFHGEIEKSIEQRMDEIIFKWFGDGYVGEK